MKNVQYIVLFFCVGSLIAASFGAPPLEAQTGSGGLESDPPMVPLIRFERFMMEADRFRMYLHGDSGYEQTVYELFLYGFGEFEVGEGALFEIRRGSGETSTRRTEVLSEESDGSRWWRIVYESPETSVSYEALVDPLGVPYQIRVENPQTGAMESRPTMIGESFREALGQMDRGQLTEAIASDRNRNIQEFRRLIEPAVMLGEEQIVTGAGEFDTVHIRRGSGGRQLHYWVDTEAPGQIVRISTAADPLPEETVAELTDIYQVR